MWVDYHKVQVLPTLTNDLYFQSFLWYSSAIQASLAFYNPRGPLSFLFSDQRNLIPMIKSNLAILKKRMLYFLCVVYWALLWSHYFEFNKLFLLLWWNLNRHLTIIDFFFFDLWSLILVMFVILDFNLFFFFFLFGFLNIHF